MLYLIVILAGSVLLGLCLSSVKLLKTKDLINWRSQKKGNWRSQKKGPSWSGLALYKLNLKVEIFRGQFTPLQQR